MKVYQTHVPAEIIKTSYEVGIWNIRKIFPKKNIFSDNKSSFPHRLAGAQLELRMNGADRIEEIIHDGDSFRGDIEQYQDAIKFLEKAKIDSTRVKEAAKIQWPLAVAFGAATDCPPRVLKPLKHQSNENNNSN